MKGFLKLQFQIVVQSIVISVVLFFVHQTLILNLLPKAVLVLTLHNIYLFHFVVTTAIVSIVCYKKQQGSDNVFNLFIFFTLVKMLLAVVFLLPVFLSQVKNKNFDVINFFIPYFIYLAFEVYSITTQLNKQN